jgi:hypothetical protein
MTKTNTIARLLPLLFAALPLTLHAGDHGTRLEFRSVPAYVDRLFVPVVPETENRLIVGSERIEAIQTPPGFTLQTADRGLIVRSTPDAAAGYARVRIGSREATLTLIPLVPYNKLENGKIDGYHVGEYNPTPLKGLSTYERPKGFIALTSTNGELWVSDHYRLRDFQCKLDGASKYLVVRTEALLKLEILQHELEAQHGLQFARFTIMSGYRTPYYNAKIGNETSNSRHLYGDAMDIYVDRDGNGKMDDVNRDGKVDSNDAKFLLQVAERIDNSKEWSWLKGGAGVYHANHAHGPYMHVDARGYVARWGV